MEQRFDISNSVQELRIVSLELRHRTPNSCDEAHSNVNEFYWRHLTAFVRQKKKNRTCVSNYILAE
jgi:hypothetical protein